MLYTTILCIQNMSLRYMHSITPQHWASIKDTIHRIIQFNFWLQLIRHLVTNTVMLVWEITRPTPRDLVSFNPWVLQTFRLNRRASSAWYCTWPKGKLIAALIRLWAVMEWRIERGRFLKQFVSSAGRISRLTRTHRSSAVRCLLRWGLVFIRAVCRPHIELYVPAGALRQRGIHYEQNGSLQTC